MVCLCLDYCPDLQLERGWSSASFMLLRSWFVELCSGLNRNSQTGESSEMDDEADKRSAKLLCAERSYR